MLINHLTNKEQGQSGHKDHTKKANKSYQLVYTVVKSASNPLHKRACNFVNDNSNFWNFLITILHRGPCFVTFLLRQNKAMEMKFRRNSICRTVFLSCKITPLDCSKLYFWLAIIFQCQSPWSKQRYHHTRRWNSSPFSVYMCKRMM